MLRVMYVAYVTAEALLPSLRAELFSVLLCQVIGTDRVVICAGQPGVKQRVWKSRTLQAEAQIVDLRLQLNDYRMQLGLPVLGADDANAPPGAPPWHKSDEHTDIGAVLNRNVPTDQAQTLSYPRMHMLSLCPSPESDNSASKP